MNIEEFAAHCKVDVVDGVLTASCIVCAPDGQCYKLSKSVDLKPAVNYVAERLATWHRSQHGLESGDHVQGFFDDVASYATKAVKVVSDVANNKTVQALYNKAAPLIEQAVRKNVPGGDTVMDIATKAHDLYDRARKDHPDAVAAVKHLVGIAETGHPQAAETIKAKFAVNVMRQASAMTQAKEAGYPAHTATAPAPGERNHRRGFYNLGVTVTSGTSELEDDNDEFDVGPYRQFDLVGDAWGDSLFGRVAARSRRRAPAARRGGVGDHRSQPGGWSGTFRQPQRMFQPFGGVQSEPGGSGTGRGQRSTPPQGGDDGRDDGQDGDDRGDDTQAQGRFWQHPYRRTAQRIVDMKDHAGVGLAARELYNRGLGRGETAWTDIATEALGNL